MTPHLIHVGFPKAGSTFLQQWFQHHPAIAYAEGGLAGVATVYDIAREAAEVEPQWRCRVTSTELLTAPRTTAWREPLLTAQVRACKGLQERFPNAQVLLVTRGFRSMILSSYSQHVRTGGTLSLPGLIAASGEHMPWDYDAVISAYRARFGTGNVLILPFELLVEDATAFLGHVAARLGVGIGPVPPAAANPSLSPTELAWYPHIAATVARLPLVGRRIARAAFQNRLGGPIRLLNRLFPLPPVNPALVTDAALERFAGTCECLREDPLFQPYRRDYLL